MMNSSDITDGLGKQYYDGFKLSQYYDVGTYEFYMGMYEMGKRLPRILSKQQDCFYDEVLAEVTKDRGYFYL